MNEMAQSTEREMIVSVIQINASDRDKEGNIQKILDFLDVAGRRGSDLVVLPETFTGTGLGDNETYKVIAEEIPGPTTDRIAAKAAEYGMTIVGSLYERGQDGAIHNTAPVIDPSGKIQIKYRKSHLFDPLSRPDIPHVHESEKVTAGSELVMAETKQCKIGVAICSDLRFPEIFLNYALKGAEIVVVPTAFLAPRADHWEFLLRARATDNQYFVIGSGMFGTLDTAPIGFVGRSMVVDPWGVTLAQAPDRECCITTVINLDNVRQVRSWWPLNEQRRPTLYNGLKRQA
ncbi:MAG: hydrolase [Flavobacteriaceae bacterium]|nr:hydrolase [Flavobacteriaceae bacterium]